jgi:hypothetical protein
MKSTPSMSDDILILEKELQHSLNPVSPDTDYLNTMKRRLVSGSSVGLETNSPVLIYLVLALGIVTGVLLIWILQRLR